MIRLADEDSHEVMRRRTGVVDVHEFELLRFMMHNSKFEQSPDSGPIVWSYGRSNIVELYISYYCAKKIDNGREHDPHAAAPAACSRSRPASNPAGGRFGCGLPVGRS